MSEKHHNSQGTNDGELNIPKLEWTHNNNEVHVRISGEWLLYSEERPRAEKKWESLLKQSSHAEVFNISCDLNHWDTSFVIFLRGVLRDLEKKQKVIHLKQFANCLNNILDLSKGCKVV